MFGKIVFFCSKTCLKQTIDVFQKPNSFFRQHICSKHKAKKKCFSNCVRHFFRHDLFAVIRRLSRLLTSSAQAAVGLVHSHCTGFRSPRGTAYSWWFADLFVLRAAHTVTVRLLFWGCFFPLSRPPLFLRSFNSYYHQACRQHAAIGSLSPIMPRWGLNSTIPHRSSPLFGAVRPIPWHGVASIFSDSLSSVSCLLLLLLLVCLLYTSDAADEL